MIMLTPGDHYKNNMTPEQRLAWNRYNEASVMGSRIKHGYLGIAYPERTAVAAHFERAAESYREQWIALLDIVPCEVAYRYSHRPHINTDIKDSVCWCSGERVIGPPVDRYTR